MLIKKLSIITCAILSIVTNSLLATDETIEIVEEQSLATIIVYGEKANRKFKDTASSLSVITEESLKSLQHISISSAISDIPNVVVLSGAAPDIRGVSGNGSATGFNGVSGGSKARVTTLIDGVAEPFMADLTGDTGIWDIEQIEIFRGPQSTSNGRNSIGGMIFIKTKDPVYEWESAVRVGYRNQSRYIDTSLMTSGPIIDNELALRLTAQILDGENYDNSVIFESHKPPFDLNEVKTQRFKGKLLWEPEALDKLSTLFTFSSNEEKGNTGRNYFTVDDPWAFIPVMQRYMNTDSKTSSLSIDYRLTENTSVDVLAAFMDYEWGFDSYEQNIAREQQLQMDEENRTLDSKFNFGLNNSEFKGFVGFAWFKRKQNYASTSAFSYYGHDESDSKAIYGEASYAFTTDFSIIAGGRIERESQYRDFSRLTGGAPSTSVLDQSKTIQLPKLVFQYTISDSTTALASARRGYNAGGGALEWATGEYYYYDSETVNTYEVGLRSTFDNSNLNISGNAFYNDYDGYQAPGIDRKINNIDDVITYGAELEISSMITQDLHINGGLGLLKSEIKDGNDIYQHIDGNELSSAPGVTANIGIRYWLADNIDAGFSANYVDNYFGEITNTQERVAGDYMVASFNINYTLENWLFNAFINNAFNKKSLLSQEPASRRYPEGYAAIVDPRTAGVSITYYF